MPRIGRLVRQNLRRHARSFALAGVGIVVGIATFVFFLALGGGARQVLLGEVFPIDRIEVVKPRTSLGGALFGSKRVLDDAVVERLVSRPQTRAAYPKMKMLFPARGWGGASVMGKDFYFDLTGFLDGIDPNLVAGELPEGSFEDYEAAGDAERPVPVLVSKHLVELYNGSIAPAQGWPQMRDWMTSQFRGLTFSAELGRSMLGGRASRGTVKRRTFVLAGVSDKAMTVGLTVPVGYIKRWNSEYVGPESAEDYSSIVVRVRSKNDVTSLVAFIRSMGFEQAESEAERVGLFVTLVTVLFALISASVVLVAALSVAHTFLMVVAERRREIGVLRAVGASRADVRVLVLSEAGVVGLLGGIAGIVVARCAGFVCDWVGARALPDFPFKPETFFSFSVPLLGGSLGFAVLCSLLGAGVAAQRAARGEPAETLVAR